MSLNVQNVRNADPGTSRIIPTSEIDAEDATPVGGATSSVFRGSWNGIKVAVKRFPHDTAPEVSLLALSLPRLTVDS